MKNIIIYLLILIFSISIISAARKNQKNCDKASVCNQLNNQKCNEGKKAEADKKAEFELAPLGLFFFNI